MIWDGREDCQHEWGQLGLAHHPNQVPQTNTGAKHNAAAAIGQTADSGQFCIHCHAWRGSLGLEPTPGLFIQHIVNIFREVWRVLRPEATLWLNIGDSYATAPNGRSAAATKAAGNDDRTFRDKPSSSVGANIANQLEGIIKNGVMFIGGRCALTISAHSDGVLKPNNVLPDGEFTRFLSVKRILFKQRDNDFCQVVNLLNPESSVRVSSSVSAIVINNTDLQIIPDGMNNISVVVSDDNLNGQSSLDVPICPLPAINSNMPLAVEESTKPVTKAVGDFQPARDTVAPDSVSKSLADVDLIDQPVTLSNALVFTPQGLRNFRITKATPEHFALSLMDGAIKITVNSVRHLFISNQFGSLVRYAELYDKAKRLSNATRAKQELGIPDLVKRALMEDGWICRSTIIWAKPNPMPESVDDRPTKAHEYVFLMTKQERYFYDAEAVRESADPQYAGRYNSAFHVGKKETNGAGRPGNESNTPGIKVFSGHRNRRTIWTIATEAYPGAHFATFPTKLVEPCVLAGTSARGCCPKCGAGWVRVVETARVGDWRSTDRQHDLEHGARGGPGGTMPGYKQPITTGWQPSCTCYRTANPTKRRRQDLIQKRYDKLAAVAENKDIPELHRAVFVLAADEIKPYLWTTRVAGNKTAPTVPAIALDPFCGSGTAGEVARNLGRRFVGLDLNPVYLAVNALPRAEGKTAEVALKTMATEGQYSLFGEAA